MKKQKIITPEWEKFQHYFKREEFSAKTVILNEGEIATKLYHVNKGCLRTWLNHNGKDITFQFFIEENIVTSVESFIADKPSMFTIETIEPSVVYSITKSDFNKMLSQSPIIKEQINELAFERLIFYQKLFLSRIKDKPEKRYLDLLENNPELLLRIPQHYIASYLGITSVSLSRIRNRV